MTLRRMMAWAGTLAVALAVAGCGGDEGNDDSGGDDTAADTGGNDDTADVDLTGKSVYRMSVTLWDGEVIELDRDLTDKEDIYFAFGSTHIAPAVSYAMNDDITFPRTMTISLNFGIVVPSSSLAIHTDGAATYPFSAGPPDIYVFVKGLEFSSTIDGAAGSIVVDEWSVVAGETVSGSFSGTLLQDTTNDEKRAVEVEGSYHFVLPSRQDGQPGGPR